MIVTVTVSAVLLVGIGTMLLGEIELVIYTAVLAIAIIQLVKHIEKS